MSSEAEHWDVIIVGGGVSGLSAGIFTARANFRTLILEFGGSIVKRNAHLENYPGFPAGIDARLYVQMLEDQVRRTGGRIRRKRVTGVRKEGTRFSVRTEQNSFVCGSVIAASWSNTEYLNELDLEFEEQGSKRFLVTDRNGRTGVPGLYGAGRLAGQYHQAIVCAGHGAQVALTMIEDSDRPFYHDWVTPQGYFTERGREVPAGCEEISREDRLRRAEEGRQVLLEYLKEASPEEPVPHPRLHEDESTD